LVVETLGAARLAKEIPAQRAVATIVPREEITAALQDPEATPELFLRITGGGLEESAEENVIAMTWSRDDLAQLLERATGENVILTFDRDELSQAIGDVEAHGMRERALVFAVVAAGALGSGAAIANAMPVGDEGGPVATSVAPASLTDVSSGGGYAAPATAATDSMISDAASGGGYSAPVSAADARVTDASSAAGYTAPVSAADARVTDASSAAGYTAPVSASDARVTDASSAAGYTAATTEAGASAADSMRTDASSSGGYGAAESTGSSGGVISVHQPGTTDGLIAGGILLAIAGATFATRRGGTMRPA
jgi:hypothetical protein